MATFLGCLLLLTPFLLIFCFTDRSRGFLYTLTADIAFHLFLALATQFFHLFSYPTILGFNLAAATAVIFILIRKNRKISFSIKLNWFLIIAFGIIILELASVHYFYSGVVSTITEKQIVTKASYPYPYFSDEWVGVAFTNYSISHNSLPIVNPLNNNRLPENFPNIFIGFFAILAEVFLLLSLPPLTGYPLLTLISGLLICLLVYILLRRNGVKLLPAVIATLCLPYIVNGQNLPGLWYLLPITGGLILFLVSLASLNDDNHLLSWGSSALALLLYPPLVVFIAPLFILIPWLDKNSKARTKLKLILSGLLIIFIAALLIIYLQRSNFGHISSLISAYLFYPALDRGIPDFFIWTVVPWLALPLAALGLIVLWQKKLFFLLAPLLIGLLFWTVYSHSLYFLVIGYDRVVLVTSVLIIISSAFGLDWLKEKITQKIPLLSGSTVNLEIIIFLLLIFLFLAFSYTQRSDWSKLVLRTKTENGPQANQPLAPATMFLSASDWRLFKDLPKKRFLTLSWKGLAIGAATGLYPLDSKSAIVTNRILSYDTFMQADCPEKDNLAQKHHLRYIYSFPFACDNFKELGKSEEGLYLYRFKP